MTDEEHVLSSFSDGTQLRTLLTITKGETTFQSNQLPEGIQTSDLLPSLESAQLLQKEQTVWLFTGYAKVRVAIRALQLGEPNRPVLSALSWQEFEEFVAHVLSFHEFNVCHRFRFSTNRRYEIDIIAGRKPVLFCIDCKQYGVRIGKASSLRTAAEEQLHRTQVLAKNFAQFQSDIGCLEWQETSLIPILVTLMVEDIQFHEKIPIVPASLFNGFLLSFEEQLDRMRVIQPSPGRQQRLI